MTRNTKVGIQIESSWRGDGVEQAKRDLGGVEQSFGRLKNVALGVAVGASAAITAFLADSIRSYQSFEQTMANVAAVSGAAGKELALLEKTAKDLGATTKFTAQEAGEGMAFLAMAGFQVNDIIGAMPGVLQLAAAANLDLGRAADITSNILTGYNKTVDEVGHVNDVLVKAFTSANVNLVQLGEAMKYAGPVASGMGIDFEEAAAAIALMGNAGIQGSMAGTSLRNALTRLAKPTSEVTETLSRLNVTTTDSNGRLLSLTEIVQQLERSGASTTDMMAIFGQRAGPAMAALVDQGSSALADFTAMLEDSGGTADRVATTQLDTLEGRVTLMSSAWDGLKIATGDALVELLRIPEAVERSTEAIGRLTEGVRAYHAIANEAFAEQLGDMVADNLAAADSIEDIEAHIANVMSSMAVSVETGKMTWKSLLPILGDVEAQQRKLSAQLRRELAAGLKEATLATIELQGGAKDLDEVLWQLFGRDARWVGDEIWIHNTFVATQEELAQYIEAMRAASFDQALFNSQTRTGVEMIEDTGVAALTAAERLRQMYADVQAAFWNNSPVDQRYTEEDDMAAYWAARMERADAITASFSQWESVFGQITQNATRSTFGLIDRLAEQQERLDNATGTWVETWRDHSGEIASISEQLANDISGGQRRSLENILRTTTEGSAEWLSAWQRLQGGLTESQRQELLARRGELEAAHGEFVNVYTGDARAAREAQEEIDRINQAISQGYREMVLEIILANFSGVFTEEVGQAALDLGLMTQAQVDARLEAERYRQEVDKLIGLFSEEFVADDGTVSHSIRNVDGLTQAYLLLESGMADTAGEAFEMISSLTEVGEEAQRVNVSAITPLRDNIEQMPDSVLIELGILGEDGTLYTLDTIEQRLSNLGQGVSIPITTNSSGLSWGGTTLPIVPQAQGGDWMVTRPTLFLAGEAGPEEAHFRPLWKNDAGNGRNVEFNAPLVNVEQMNASDPLDVHEMAYTVKDIIERSIR